MIARNSDSPEDIYTFRGKKLKLPPFTEIYIAEKQDLMLIKNDEQSALYDSVGNEIYPMSADEIFVSDLEDTFIPIRKGEKWGMINREGHIVALFAYDYLETVQQGAEELVIFEQGSKTGIMDTELNVLFEDTQEIRYDKTMGLFYKVGKAGYFDKNGTMVK